MDFTRLTKILARKMEAEETNQLTEIYGNVSYLSEKDRLERIVDKICSRGGVNASQEYIDLTMLDEDRKSVIFNAFGNFWYEDGKRLEKRGRDSGYWGDLGTAEDWFLYAVEMFGKPIPELRLSNLEEEILPHIIRFSEDYSQERLLQRAKELGKTTPDVVRMPNLRESEFYGSLPTLKKRAIMKADKIAKYPYHYGDTYGYHSGFKKMASLYRTAGEFNLAKFCGQNLLARYEE